IGHLLRAGSGSSLIVFGDMGHRRERGMAPENCREFGGALLGRPLPSTPSPCADAAEARQPGHIKTSKAVLIILAYFRLPPGFRHGPLDQPHRLDRDGPLSSPGVRRAARGHPSLRPAWPPHVPIASMAAKPAAAAMG